MYIPVAYPAHMLCLCFQVYLMVCGSSLMLDIFNTYTLQTGVHGSHAYVFYLDIYTSNGWLIGFVVDVRMYVIILLCIFLVPNLDAHI